MSAAVEIEGEPVHVWVHDVDGVSIEVAPIRFEVSWATANMEAGKWSPSSITIIGRPKGAPRTGDPVASHYSGAVDVCRALARLPEEFRKHVEAHSPARWVNH